MTAAITPQRRDELAWAAGFFDGEGHIRFRDRRVGGSKTKRSPEVIMEVGQSGATIPFVLERFRLAVWGLGKTYGPYIRKAPHLPRWTYRTTRFEHSQATVAALWNWLSPAKRQQAAAALLKARAVYRIPTPEAIYQRGRKAAILAGTWKKMG